MEKENQRVTVTKRMLREGLLRLLKTKPLEKISITELCREADVNRVTFYRHYETPRDVLVEVERMLIREQKDSLKFPRTLPEMKQYLEDSCAFLDANADLVRIILQNNTDSEFYTLFDDLFREVCKDRDLGQVLGHMDPDALQILSICSAGSSYFLLRQWLLGNIRKTPQQIAAIFYNQLCNTDWASLSRQLGLT